MAGSTVASLFLSAQHASPERIPEDLLKHLYHAYTVALPVLFVVGSLLIVTLIFLGARAPTATARGGARDDA